MAARSNCPECSGAITYDEATQVWTHDEDQGDHDAVVAARRAFFSCVNREDPARERFAEIMDEVSLPEGGVAAEGGE